ncbi:hypothetical protein AB1A65_09820 [Muricauda sp. ANG21]|uniref:hypothetical protein n=1 Tax=Allomuricauda sp. ANG21 TaxID=3042468 RepID=UPI003455BAF3
MATQPHPFKKEVMDEKLRELVFSDFLKGERIDEDDKGNERFTLKCRHKTEKRSPVECGTSKLNSKAKDLYVLKMLETTKRIAVQIRLKKLNH